MTASSGKGKASVMGSAVISGCGSYRYQLWRSWLGGEGYVLIVGLNPSKADAAQDDPTIRRCVDFAQRWGFSALAMGNLFAFRATKPEDMMAADDPVGPENDVHLEQMALGARLVVAAWGTQGSWRAETVRNTLPNLHYLALSKDGQPRHPLYLPKNLVPTPWR